MTPFEHKSHAVMDLTERLAAAARAGEWEQAVQLQEARAPALRALLGVEHGGADIAGRTVVMRRLLALESEITRLTASAHASICAELADLRRRAGAQSAYARTQLRD